MEKKIEEGNSTNSKTQLIIVFLIGFLLGLLVGPTFTSDSEDVVNEEEVVGTEEVSTVDDGTPNMVPSTPSNSEVNVSNQLAGDRVALDSVSFENEGWAVVHESIDGVPANALGAQRFDPGEYIEGHVDLLRNTEVGNVYFVILYGEDGDGEFNIKKDTPLLKADGEFVSKTFETIQLDRKN